MLRGGGGQAATTVVRQQASLPTPTSTSLTASTDDVPRLDGSAEPPPSGHVFDTVIENGRVMDPETGYDQVASVGIGDQQITSISTDPLSGRETIDAAGLVVAPGFIDLLSYEPNEYGIWYKVADGVTTNLGMHGVNARAAEFFPIYEGRTPCHYGGAFDNPYLRNTQVGLSITETAQPYQIDQLTDLARAELSDGGWLGIDFEPEYTPGIDTAEIMALANVAAEEGVPVFFHARYSSPERNAEAIDEVVRVARETGAAAQVEHITSTGGTHTMEATLSTIADARSEGLDITADMYPYNFWATTLGAARFDPDPVTGAPAVERFRIEFEDLALVGSGRRLDEFTFNQMRQNGENPLIAAVDSIPEPDIEAALQADFVMVASDGILEPGDRNHPRSTGCFSRTLGEYVRDRGVITLMDGLAKMTSMPAERLASTPAMTKKGRVQIGADADITVFDPETVSDQSTITDPAQESTGIEYVMVLGQLVKTPAGLQRDVLPGQPIRRTA